jgi:hypothetical protein
LLGDNKETTDETQKPRDGVTFTYNEQNAMTVENTPNPEQPKFEPVDLLGVGEAALQLPQARSEIIPGMRKPQDSPLIDLGSSSP